MSFYRRVGGSSGRRKRSEGGICPTSACACSWALGSAPLLFTGLEIVSTEVTAQLATEIAFLEVPQLDLWPRRSRNTKRKECQEVPAPFPIGPLEREQQPSAGRHQRAPTASGTVKVSASSSTRR